MAATSENGGHAATSPEQAGIQAARAYCGWYLGDKSWADNIIDAYLNPEAATKRLRAAKANFDAV